MTEWDRWRGHLAPAADRGELERRLSAVARSIGWRVRTPEGAPRWERIGVECVIAPMRTSGGRVDLGERTRVYLARDDSPARRTYTVAHEVAHRLLGEHPVVEASDPREVERLCDRFAQAVLLPRRELAAWLGVHPLESVLDVFATARRFGVSITAALNAVNSVRESNATALVAASWAGHPRRPEEMEFRIRAAVQPSVVYLPRHQRLCSLGLSSLSAWAREAAHQEEAEGSDELVARDATGPVAWSAVALGSRRSLLAQLDMSLVRGVAREAAADCAAVPTPLLTGR